MIDISKQEITINCPECNSPHKVTLGQVQNQEVIKCPVCNKNITLVDKDGSTRKSIASISKSLRDLEDSLSKFGK